MDNKNETQKEKIVIREEELENGKKVVHLKKECSKEKTRLEHKTHEWQRTTGG